RLRIPRGAVDPGGATPRLGGGENRARVHADRQARGSLRLGNDLQESARGSPQVEDVRSTSEEVESRGELLQLEGAAGAEPLPLGLLEVVVLRSVRLAHRVSGP